MKRVCKQCGASKGLRSFAVASNGKRRIVCRTCCNSWQKDKYSHEVSDQRARSRRYYETVSGRAASLIRSASARAKRKGLICDLSCDWVAGAIANGVCAVTGLQFHLGRSRSFKNPLAPSLDRIDTLGDYTPNNVRVVVECYNAARGEWGDWALKILVEALHGKL